MNNKIENFLSKLDKETKNPSTRIEYADRALYLLLLNNKNRLPDLDGRFHKTFRQTDVAKTGEEDMAIHHLINFSSVFWEVFESFKEKESEE